MASSREADVLPQPRPTQPAEEEMPARLLMLPWEHEERIMWEEDMLLREKAAYLATASAASRAPRKRARDGTANALDGEDRARPANVRKAPHPPLARTERGIIIATSEPNMPQFLFDADCSHAQSAPSINIPNQGMGPVVYKTIIVLCSFARDLLATGVANPWTARFGSEYWWDVINRANDAEYVTVKHAGTSITIPNPTLDFVGVEKIATMRDVERRAFGVLNAKLDKLRNEAITTSTRAIDSAYDAALLAVLNGIMRPTYPWNIIGMSRTSVMNRGVVPHPRQRWRYLCATEVTRANVDALLAWRSANAEAVAEAVDIYREKGTFPLAPNIIRNGKCRKTVAIKF